MAKWSNRIAKGLAILGLTTMINAAAHAEETGVSVPRSALDPVSVHLAESAAAWGGANPSEILQVFVGAADPCCDGRTPIAGRTELNDGALTFTPAFSFVTGQAYVARVLRPGASDMLVPFRIPSDTAMTNATITEIYPSGDTLPENVLRFYIHFSVPMSPHVAFDFVRLRDATGTADHAAFMKFKQELWNEDRTRLTVLIDPGRIKRDVATNLDLGPALRAGQNYTVSVEGGWRSADGASVLPAFSKTFAVSDALRERPDVRLWLATPPCTGTREALKITFDRPFDRHLLNKDIQVATEGGRAIGGVIDVTGHERVWTFIPDESWPDGELSVVANPELEDVAGNNFRDLLDQLESTGVAGPASSTTLRVKLKNCFG